MANWYYLADGQEIGPIGGAVVKQLIAAGLIQQDTLIKQEGSSQWVVAGKLSGVEFPDSQPVGITHPPKVNIAPHNNAVAMQIAFASDVQVMTKAFIYWFAASIVLALAIAAFNLEFILFVLLILPFYVWLSIYTMKVALSLFDFGVVIIIGVCLIIPLANLVAFGIVGSLAGRKIKTFSVQ